MSAANLLGSTRVARVGDGVLAIADFSYRRRLASALRLQQKIVSARRRNQHAVRVRSPIG
jgi:hypothetical protein